MLPYKKENRQFILKGDNDKRIFTKKIAAPQNQPLYKNQPPNEEFYQHENKSPPINFNRSNSTFKKSDMNDHNMKNLSRHPEEKEFGTNKFVMKYPEVPLLKATTLPEVSDKEIMSSKLFLDLKTKYEYEKEKTSKMKKLLYEKETEIQTLKQDKLQLYNKVAMMEEQIRNYEVAFEERKNNVTEVSFPDFQSLLMALRYSGNFRRRTPAREELNPDHMTYEELMHLEEQMGTVSRGFTEEQLSKLNTFIFNSKFNPNCNNQDSCTICCSEYTAGNRLSKLGCGHVYHNNCIRPWLLNEKTCPICKALVNL